MGQLGCLAGQQHRPCACDEVPPAPAAGGARAQLPTWTRSVIPASTGSARSDPHSTLGDGPVSIVQSGRETDGVPRAVRLGEAQLVHCALNLPALWLFP